MYDTIREAALGLSEGDTVALHCPKCQADHEKKFYVSIRGGYILFNCKRASCGWSGSLSVNGCSERRTFEKSLQKNQYTGKPVPLTLASYEYLQGMYGIDPAIAARELLWDERREAYIAEVFDSKGACKGTTARYTSGSTKARSWIEDYEQVMWMRGAQRHDYLFIVEGLLDGLKMCSYGDVLVLLGTSMNQNTMQEVSRVFNKQPKLKIVWLLDPDATNKAVHLQHQSKLYFPSFVVMLNADPKDADKAYLDTCFK